MIIRNEQVEVFARVAEKRFLDTAVQHMQAYDSLLTRAAGETNVRLTAEVGIARARRYGFTDERSILLYLELVMSFGLGFDRDPQYAWMRPYLQEMEGLGSFERSRVLYWHVSGYLDRAYGEKGEHGKAALERVSYIDMARLGEVAEDPLTRGRELLEYLHPQRMPFLENGVVESLLAAAQQQAVLLDLGAAEGPVLLLLLLFAFGHQIVDDPLHPWIRKTNAQLAGVEARARVEQLFHRAKMYTRIMLAQVTEGKK